LRGVTRIHAETFKEARLLAALSIAATAELLGVTQRTIRNWERGRHQVPPAALALVRFASGYALPDPAWSGWVIHSGKLWPPGSRRGFEPAHLEYLDPLIQMAKLWQQAQAAKAPATTPAEQLALFEPVPGRMEHRVVPAAMGVSPPGPGFRATRRATDTPGVSPLRASIPDATAHDERSALTRGRSAGSRSLRWSQSREPR